MADNVQAEAVVTPGASFATDEDGGGVHHPYAKLEWGADGTFTKVAAGAGALPIQDGGNSITVDGTVGVAGGSVGLLASAAQIGTVIDGGAGKTLKRAVVALTGDGDVVALVATKRIKVYAYEIQSSADGITVHFRSNDAAGIQLGIPWVFNTREGAMGSAVNPPAFLFATVAGEALFAIINGTGTANIAVSYFDDDVV